MAEYVWVMPWRQGKVVPVFWNATLTLVSIQEAESVVERRMW